MRRAVKILVGFIGVAVAATAAALWMAPQAIAQVRSALVRDVDHPANAPFAWEVIASASASNPIINGTFTVPSTTSDGRNVQRLVIETVSALCIGLTTPPPGVRVTGPTATAGIGGLSNVESFIPFGVGPAPTSYVMHAQTRFYVNPGVLARINLLEFETAGLCSFSMSGHFVTQ